MLLRKSRICFKLIIERQWHTVRALESGTVIMEVKDGPYEPTGEEDILSV